MMFTLCLVSSMCLLTRVHISLMMCVPLAGIDVCFPGRETNHQGYVLKGLVKNISLGICVLCNTYQGATYITVMSQ